MTKLLILNDTSDQQNWGAFAGVEALKRILQAALPDAVFDTITSREVGRIYLFDPHIRGQRMFNRTSHLADLLLPRYEVLPRVSDEYEYVGEVWDAGKGGVGSRKFVKKCMWADAVVFNAEGSTYRNNYSAIKALFMLWYARTRFSIPAFFVNGSVTITEVDPILPAMLKKTFRVLDGISVRTPNSLRMVQNLLPGLSVQLIPDTAFLYDEQDCRPDSPSSIALRQRLGNGPYFCFSLSMLPMDFVRTRRRSSLVRLIQRLKEIVPQAILMAKDPADAYLKAVAEETGAIFYGPGEDFRNVMAILRDARFLLSGRYHHLILAADVGCPVIPMISTSPKVQGLVEMLGDVATRPFDPTDLWSCMDTMVETARQIIGRGDRLREAVRQKAAELRRQVFQVGELVRRGIDAASTSRR